jgi:biopolymer transport protein ExbD
MRLPRNFKMLRGPMDSAALTGALCLLWMVTILHSSLVMPPGIRLELPEAPGVVGEVLPRFSLAVDAAGRLVFEHQLLPESNLVARLRARTTNSTARPTLLLMADRQVPAETLARLVTLARSAGVEEVVLATSPRALVPAAAGTAAAKRP